MDSKRRTVCVRERERERVLPYGKEEAIMKPTYNKVQKTKAQARRSV